MKNFVANVGGICKALENTRVALSEFQAWRNYLEYKRNCVMTTQRRCG